MLAWSFALLSSSILFVQVVEQSMTAVVHGSMLDDLMTFDCAESVNMDKGELISCNLQIVGGTHISIFSSSNRSWNLTGI